MANVGYLSNMRSSEVTITRPANQTPYTIGDIVGHNTGNLGNLVFNVWDNYPGQGIYIVGAYVRINFATVPGTMTAGFTLHMLNKAPTAQADNAVFSLATTDSLVHTIELPTPVSKGNILWAENFDIVRAFPFAVDQCSITGNLVTNSGFTPPNNSTVISVGIVYASA